MTVTHWPSLLAQLPTLNIDSNSVVIGITCLVTCVTWVIMLINQVNVYRDRLVGKKAVAQDDGPASKQDLKSLERRVDKRLRNIDKRICRLTERNHDDKGPTQC